MAVLITGANGFIGAELANRLAASRSVVCMSRGKPLRDLPFVKGSFDRFEDLRQLDRYEIDTVVHLAAVTGSSSEEDALAVNVQGTRRLFRYLLDRGCGKLITASSIAAVGCLDRKFAPLRLPIPDDHPCLATDAYGFSKAMVEQLTHYFHRSHPATDFINFRFGVVVADDWTAQPVGTGTALSIPFAQLARVYVSDIVDAVEMAVEAPVKPGVRVCNILGADSSCDAPTADMLRAVLGERAGQYDLSYYERPGHERKPIYAMERMRDEFGFVPARSTRKEVSRPD